MSMTHFIGTWAIIAALAFSVIALAHEHKPEPPRRMVEKSSHCPIVRSAIKQFSVGVMREFFTSFDPDDEFIPLRHRFIYCSKHI